MTDSYVQALLREREGYRRAGKRLAHRLIAVDAELARFGIHVDDAPEAAVNRPPERAVKPRPRKR